MRYRIISVIHANFPFIHSLLHAECDTAWGFYPESNTSHIQPMSHNNRSSIEGLLMLRDRCVHVSFDVCVRPRLGTFFSFLSDISSHLTVSSYWPGCEFRWSCKLGFKFHTSVPISANHFLFVCNHFSSGSLKQRYSVEVSVYLLLPITPISDNINLLGWRMIHFIQLSYICESTLDRVQNEDIICCDVIFIHLTK